MNEHAAEGRRPISWHVGRWGDEEFSRGSWSYVRPGGSSADRWTLAEPIDDRLALCGEAIGNDQPGMTHGAFESGERAATWCVSAAKPGERVAIIGAGMAGLAAARLLRGAGVETVVVEARHRIGGRINTIELDGASGPIAADAGAAWLQQFGRNPLATIAAHLGVTLVATDFHRPLAGSDDTVGDVAAALEQLRRAAAQSPADSSLADVIARMDLDAVRRHALQQAIDGDVVLETGANLEDTSARSFFAEDGVGVDDHWIVGGHRVLLDHLASGLDIRLGQPARSITWTANNVTVATDHQTLVVDRCIATLPISLLQRDEPVLRPGLPDSHREALSRLGMGVVEKVLLRFEERWWPRPPHGYMRWYESPASWCEWLDLTDGCGAPVVAGLIGGEAVTRHHHGRTDEDVAQSAADALGRWADAVR